jgi:hypothetical protein
MLNAYFNNFNYGREQDLVEDLTIECLKMYGYNVRVHSDQHLFVKIHYLVKTRFVSLTMLLNLKCTLRTLKDLKAKVIFLSKFNLEIRDQITLTVARKRFDQAKSEKLTTEVGYNILTEDADTNAPSRQYLSTAYAGDSIQLEEGGLEGYSITTNRPTEGDLIYFPLVKKLFEIKFVEHEQVFYQTGRLQTYDIRCELFEYSSEQIDTGISDIDSIEDNYTTDILAYEMLLEDDEKLLNEDGGSIMQEYRVEDSQLTANNSYFQSNDPIFSPSSVIDFSEKNPFGEVDRY